MPKYNTASSGIVVRRLLEMTSQSMSIIPIKSYWLRRKICYHFNYSLSAACALKVDYFHSLLEVNHGWAGECKAED